MDLLLFLQMPATIGARFRAHEDIWRFSEIGVPLVIAHL